MVETVEHNPDLPCYILIVFLLFVFRYYRVKTSFNYEDDILLGVSEFRQGQK